MDWTARVRGALAETTPAVDDDVIEELAQHVRAVYEASRAEGCSAADADTRVREYLVRWQREAAALRHARQRAIAIAAPAPDRGAWLSGLGQDARYGIRLLARQPRHAVTAALTMALGIAAATVLFSAAYGLLARPLPWANGDRVVALAETRGGRAPRFGTFSNTAAAAWKEDARTIDEIGAWSVRGATLAGAGDPERIRIAAVSASLFRVLGAEPLLGSLFQDADEIVTSGAPIVLSESLWRTRFGGDRAALGRLVEIDGRGHRITGVLPSRLAYPDRETQAWVPYRIAPPAGQSLSMFNAIALLRPGVDPAQAAVEGSTRGRAAGDSGMTALAIFGSNEAIQVAATPLRDDAIATVRRPLLIMMLAVALLVAAATANVAGLQLVRATARQRELAIRSALGAGRRRITRQLVVESLMLGAAGGAAGLLLASLLHGILPSVLPADFPRSGEIRMDVVVVGFAIALAILVSVGATIAPAWRVMRGPVAGALRQDGDGTARSGGTVQSLRGRTAIMAAQIAIACVLLSGALLLGRSFNALLHADLGYDPSRVLIARLSLPSSVITPERSAQVVDAVLGRLAAAGGVANAAFTSELPLTPGGSTSAFNMRSPGAGETIGVHASPRIVSSGYFAALGIPIVEGRGFTDDDTHTSRPVIVVNRTFAKRYLGERALGATLPFGVGYRSDVVDGIVVGVAEDVRYVSTRDRPHAEIYYAHRQFAGRLPVPSVTFTIRAFDDDPALLSSALRTAVREADARLVPDGIMPMTDRMLTMLARPRFYAILLGLFAAFATVLAAVGLFGVLSYAVAQRSRELAVRMALGARRVDVVNLVLGHALAVAGGGLVAGLPVAFALARSMEALLYGVTAGDVTTYIAVPALILVLAIAAAAGPAYRASHADPMSALRG
jgi:putative ABC transport system permease protein